MAKTRSKAVRKPRLLITTQDHAIIAAMIGSAPTSAAAMLLEDELDRAVLVDETSNTRPFGRIGSWVTYEDHSSGQIREIRLVLPADADIDKRWVSILSLVGASLLGLAVGAEFGWIDDKGRPHRLKVLDVVNSHDAHVCQRHDVAGGRRVRSDKRGVVGTGRPGSPLPRRRSRGTDLGQGC